MVAYLGSHESLGMVDNTTPLGRRGVRAGRWAVRAWLAALGVSALIIALTSWGSNPGWITVLFFAVLPALIDALPLDNAMLRHIRRTAAWVSCAAIASVLAGSQSFSIIPMFMLGAAMIALRAPPGRELEGAWFCLIGLVSAQLLRSGSSLEGASLAANAVALSASVALGMLLYGAFQRRADDELDQHSAARAAHAVFDVRPDAPDGEGANARTADGKTKFYAQLNHELRTPLNAILGFSDIMKQRVFGPIPDKYGEYVDLIHESASHLFDLVGSVIDLSKLEAGAYQLETVRHDAREASEAAVRMLSVLAEKAKVEVSDVSASEPVWVEADPRALRQIAINLLANAVKFTPEGGSANVSVRAQDGELVIDVTDTGSGMSEDELANLGRPYVQAGAGRASAEPGSGLGLAIVRGLAEMHGGKLTARSQLGEGSVIGVRAPVLVQEGGEAA